MPVDFQQRKLAHRFSQLDGDQDGRVQKSDLDAIVQALADRLVSPDKPQVGAELRSGYDALWNVLSGGAEVVTFERYASALSHPGAFDASIHMIGHSLFDALDIDANERIDPDELFRLGAAFGHSRAETDEIFARMDPEGTGGITREHWMDAVRDFYFGDDETSAGAVLFGLGVPQS